MESEPTNPRKRKYSTQGSYRINKKISTDNSSTGSSKTSPNTRPLICRFWTQFTKERSEQTLSCTKSDCRELNRDQWDSSARKLGQGSWFSVKQTRLDTKTFTNFQKNRYVPLPSLWPETKTTDEVKEESKEIAMKKEVKTMMKKLKTKKKPETTKKTKKPTKGKETRSWKSNKDPSLSYKRTKNYPK